MYTLLQFFILSVKNESLLGQFQVKRHTHANTTFQFWVRVSMEGGRECWVGVGEQWVEMGFWWAVILGSDTVVGGRLGEKARLNLKGLDRILSKPLGNTLVSPAARRGDDLAIHSKAPLV